MSALTTRKLLLAHRPSGEVKDSDFELLRRLLRGEKKGKLSLRLSARAE